jgi:NAD+ kinase
MERPARPKKLSRVGVIAHPEVRRELVAELVCALRKKTKDICFDPLAASKTCGTPTLVRNMDIDLAVILGGDGTLLWSVSELSKNPLILGINTGRVGYLTELHAKNGEIEKSIAALYAGKYSVDVRAKLKVNGEYEVLNEVVILPQRPASLMEYRIRLDKEPAVEFRADGVLVSTQTGSTGHSLSLGGPMIHPAAKVYLIAPMIPYMKEQPGIIVPDGVKTEIEFCGKKKDSVMVLDGNIVKKIHHSEKILIEKSRNTTRFVRFNDSKWKIKPTKSKSSSN